MIINEIQEYNAFNKKERYLYGTAVLLEEVGKIIKKGGVGVTISSQSGKRMKQLTKEEDELLATTDTEELLKLDILQPKNIKDTLHAYQMTKRCYVCKMSCFILLWKIKTRNKGVKLFCRYYSITSKKTM